MMVCGCVITPASVEGDPRAGHRIGDFLHADTEIDGSRLVVAGGGLHVVLFRRVTEVSVTVRAAAAAGGERVAAVHDDHGVVGLAGPERGDGVIVVHVHVVAGVLAFHIEVHVKVELDRLCRVLEIGNDEPLDVDAVVRAGAVCHDRQGVGHRAEIVLDNAHRVVGHVQTVRGDEHVVVRDITLAVTVVRSAAGRGGVLHPVNLAVCRLDAAHTGNHVHLSIGLQICRTAKWATDELFRTFVPFVGCAGAVAESAARIVDVVDRAVGIELHRHVLVADDRFFLPVMDPAGRIARIAIRPRATSRPSDEAVAAPCGKCQCQA